MENASQVPIWKYLKTNVLQKSLPLNPWKISAKPMEKRTICIVLNTKNAKVFINDNDNPNDNNSFGRHTYLYL